MRRPKSRAVRKQQKNNELQEIEILSEWIESQKPESGSNPLSLDPLKSKSPIGRIVDPESGAVLFSRYAGARKFCELPLSKRTKNGLEGGGFKKMTDIQVASLPHALCGRDILGAAKTGSGKTLAFVIPVLEKLHRERWGPEDGVGSIIISPTRELAGQLFDVLKTVGKHHNFSAGLLIGGRKEVDSEKERVNELNILVCTPGRLLQHMDETPNFDCSQLQVLVLDEADRILDIGFKKTLNAIVSQLPKRRQTLLFSATQTKSVQDLARLSLKDPEYISVHEKAVTATPSRLQQTAMIVPLEQKLDMLWSFIKAHLRSKILVFLSSCKEVKFVFEAFKKLRPGIPLKCLHGRMNQEKRLGIYSQFCESQSVLFSTDVASRGLDFNKAVDWVVQVDCPEDVASYIHRVGRTARYLSGGRSVLFLTPSEMKMLEKLQAAKVPIQFIKANTKRLQPVSGLLSALLVKYPDMQQLAQRAFITYLRSIYIQKDKEVFDVTKLPIDEYSASLGLPMTPKVKFLKQKEKRETESEKSSLIEPKIYDEENESVIPKEELLVEDVKDNRGDKDFLLKDDAPDVEGNTSELGDIVSATRVLKKKKLKINVHRPVGTRVVFDEEGNTQAPLAMLADKTSGDILLDQDKKNDFYKKMREELKQVDKEDKLLERQRLREKRIKKKMKLKKGQREEEDGDEEEDDLSGSEGEPDANRKRKRSKIYFHSDSDDGEKEEDKAGSAESKKLSHFDFPPYGRTFFDYPTGRCSDGRLVIDFIAEEFGLPFLPPYFGGENGKPRNLENGVNFAVVGATALDDVFFKERGIHNPSTNVSLGVELGFFKDVLPSLCSSSSDCKEFLKKSLIVMGEIGGNDYNYAFLQGKSTEEILHFVPLVVDTIASAIMELIGLGAVTILVPGNLPIGCSPAYLTYFHGSDMADYDPLTGCITWLNQFSEFHNEQLQKKLDQIRKLHRNVNIIYADYYNIAMRFYHSRNQFGFTETLRACCGGGGRYNYSSSMACGDPPLTTSCKDPSSHVSWDGLHYTEATYRWISKGVLEELYAIPYTNSLCFPSTVGKQIY